MPCDNPDHDLFPHYGVAPHKHDMRGGSFIGSTRIEPKESWPQNFIEDPEEPGCGTYICPSCLGKDA